MQSKFAQQVFRRLKMLENPRLRLGVVLWLAGMVGIVVLSVTVLPQLLEKAPRTVPLGAAIAASVLQSGVLLALAVWVGVALSRSLGLGAPAIEAALSGTGVWPVIKRQLIPATVVGLFGYIIVGNTVPGILFGFLYWRYGLESAILAHAISHAVASLAAVA
jgi:hypothetical protein